MRCLTSSAHASLTHSGTVGQQLFPGPWCFHGEPAGHSEGGSTYAQWFSLVRGISRCAAPWMCPLRVRLRLSAVRSCREVRVPAEEGSGGEADGRQQQRCCSPGRSGRASLTVIGRPSTSLSGLTRATERPVPTTVPTTPATPPESTASPSRIRRSLLLGVQPGGVVGDHLTDTRHVPRVSQGRGGQRTDRRITLERGEFDLGEPTRTKHVPLNGSGGTGRHPGRRGQQCRQDGEGRRCPAQGASVALPGVEAPAAHRRFSLLAVDSTPSSST